MREERINRRIRESIDTIPVSSLREFLEDRLRFERSKLDSDQPYFKNSYRDSIQQYAPDEPGEFDNYDAKDLTERGEEEFRRETVVSESEPIQIHEIRLKNWRQYGGEQIVDLSAKNQRLVNVIEGENGAGKSNFLSAITLCFYGKEVQERSTSNDLEGQPFVTLSRLNEAESGESVTGFIEVVLGAERPEYRFRREFTTQKRDDENYDDTLDELELRRLVDGEWERTDNPSSYLNRVLPARVSDYFLFDGEDLDVFFEEGYSERVEDAIFDVSHLELLNRAIDHLMKVRKDLESEASDVKGEVSELRSELEHIEQQLETRRSQLNEVEQTIADTKNEISGINSKLKDLSDEYVQRRYGMVDEKQERVAELEEQREALKSEIKEILIQTGPTLYAADVLLEAMDYHEEISETMSLPPKIQRQFIDELIKRGQCICGRPVKEHSGEEKHLEELREQVFDVSEAQIEDSSIIPTLFENLADQMDLLIDKRRNAAQIDDEIEELKEEIHDIKSELQAYEIPDIDIESLENNRMELEKELDELHEKRARIQIEVEDLEERYNQIQSEFHEELEKQEEHNTILAQLSLVNMAEDCLLYIRDTILDEIRTRTESNMTEYFNQLIWKEERYEINLREDYSIQVLDEFGENKIGSLSAGETQVLALSFMAALSQISGFDAPVVIDTPLGRISSTPKRLIAKNLPKYMDNTQITFLMTDEEYTEEVRELMADSVGNEYRLVFEDNETTIIAREEAQEVDV